MTRAVYRFVDYVVQRDPIGELSWSAECVAGEDGDYGAQSGELPDEQVAVRWMARHRADTGHECFRRRFTDYATARVAEPVARVSRAKWPTT